MKKVENKKTINNLAIMGMKAKRNKYMILVLAVILTSLLFSTLFAVGGSMINEIQESTMRQVGGRSHAGFKYLTKAEYEQIKDDPKLKNVSYRILIGTGENEELKKTYSECYYAEDQNAKDMFCYPTVGKMPKAENEVVLSDIILDRLGIPCELGQSVTLELGIYDRIIKYDFVLSGYYEGDPISTAQMIFVSKAFQEIFAPAKTVPYPEAERADYTGRYSVDFSFSNSIDIEGKVDKLIQRTGIRKNVDVGINWAYGTASIDPAAAAICAVLTLIFMFAGYLIIYNIFDINIVSDIQEFGLLKTVGTTEKQLRKIVMKRANIIALIGIPVGMLLGILVAALLLPVISNEFSTVNVGKGQLRLNIWILLGAALFSYLTVVLSANKPCRKASKVSPVETVKYTQDMDKNGKPKKKYTVVVLSISLALIVLNSVYGFVSGFSMDGYVRNMIISDFSIQEATLDNPGAHNKETEAIDHEFIEELKELDGVEALSPVYYREGDVDFDDSNFDKVKENIIDSGIYARKAAAYGYPEEEIALEKDAFIKDRNMSAKIYGMGEFAVSKLKVIETADGSDIIDWDKFNSGDYVMIGRFKDDNFAADILSPGDKISIRSYDPAYMTYETYTAPNGSEFEIPSYDDAPVKEYEIFAVVDVPLAMELRSYRLNECDLILSEKEFLESNGADCGAMRVLMDVDDQKEESINNWLKDYTTTVNRDLEYDSKESITEEYSSLGKMFKIVGTVLAAVLALIGLMNFANTIITSIIVRSRELAMLEAVGMTGKQQIVRLVKEGGVYFVLATIVSIVLSSVLSVTLLRELTKGLSMFEWKFTLMPIIACLPFIAVLVVIIPALAYIRLSKQSVVDRLRVE
ncbi:MAG: ABC transporter permease [Lachnospiraceae bacterium]|nr:ABC transporter permease [Lachnospiraceae bacterium]